MAASVVGAVSILLAAGGLPPAFLWGESFAWPLVAGLSASSATPGVIPTFVILGPLALLAALFPVVFGGLALLLRRWLVLFSVASLLSTLYLLHACLGGRLGRGWWGSSQALWVLLALICVAGVVWSWRRNRSLVRPGWPWGRESLALCGLTIACAAMALGSRPRIPEVEVASAFEAPVLAWVFEAPVPGKIASSPLLVGDSVYIAAAHGTGLGDFGRLYCLDAATGQVRWQFDDERGMKPVFSTPCVAGGRLYIGEGFHQDEECRLYCLNPQTGKKLWDFPTQSHTESSPCVQDGKVFFGAGEDGVFCLDAGSGRELWHFRGLHVDASPAVAGQRVYAGSGYGETFQAFCLDAATGQHLWRTRCDLPVWGSPVVANDQVFFGLGNGDFIQSDSHPAGALLCLDAGTGDIRWRHPAGDAVLARPAVDERNVYLCSRDAYCYALDRDHGRLLWKHDVGSPAVAAPSRAGSALYALGSTGEVCRFDAATGALSWRLSVAQQAEGKPQVLSSPAVATLPDGTRRIYVAASLDKFITSSAVLYCLDDGER